MAGEKLPSRVPWPDDIKRNGELTIGFGNSIGKAVWDRVFKEAIFEFNKLSNTHKLGVTFAIGDEPAKANVEARAASGDFEFTYPPDIPKQTIRFDGKGTHGLCKPLLSEFIGRSRVAEYRMAKAIIYVPANPMGLGQRHAPRARRSDQAGDCRTRADPRLRAGIQRRA